MTAALEATRGSYDERLATLSSQLKQQDEQISNSARENTLRHAQVQRLADARPAGGVAGSAAEKEREGVCER